ncbi:MAG TPA: DNA polymerase III subunit gamma/tau [Aestuariivirga sp.]|nr:DNA polymerase III subunit gamma/tau [Aestuariivirga sp.]
MTETPDTMSAQGYRVLARKYRPQNFADLIGQEAMVRTLTNAVATGRIAQAYMLTGVRGIGKTTTARLIARALNYPGAPSIEMPELTPQCEAILESRHMDVIEMDAASNTGVDNMREIIDSVRYAPVSLRYKIYIIDEVHMLSKSAFNALLKTLEEPPPHIKFIFATTEIRKVPVTILSRCQRFDLKRLDAALLMQHYARIAALENVTIDEESLRMIARASEGSVRDGLSLLDQAIAYGEGKVKAAEVAGMMGLIDRSRIIDLFDAVMTGDTAKAIHEIEAQHEGGGDPETILNDLADFVHWVTRLKVVKDSALTDPSRTEAEKTRGADYAARLGMAHLTRAWQMLLKGIAEVSYASQPLLAAEMVLIRLAHAADLPSGEDLLKLVKQNPPAEKSSPIVMAQPAKRDLPIAESVGSLALKPEAAAPQAPTETRAFSSFADIIALVVEKRDVKLKGDLERFVRPIRVAPGQIELAMEQGASPGLPGELSRKLEAWTGRRWMVLVAKEGGDKPLALQKKDAKESAFREAREEPSVQAILKRFPGSTVTDVRDPETLKPVEESDEESR